MYMTTAHLGALVAQRPWILILGRVDVNPLVCLRAGEARHVWLRAPDARALHEMPGPDDLEPRGRAHAQRPHAAAAAAVAAARRPAERGALEGGRTEHVEVERGGVVAHVRREVVPREDDGEVRGVVQVRRLAVVPADVEAQAVIPEGPVVAGLRVAVDEDALGAEGLETGREDEAAVSSSTRGRV